MSKTKDTLASRNFFVALASTLLMALQANNLQVDIDPGNLVDTLLGGDLMGIVSVLLLNFLNPAMKLISRAGEWSWDFLKSPNFLTQAFTVLLAALALIGLSMPADIAATELLHEQSWGLLSLAIFTHVANSVYHIAFDRTRNRVGEEDKK